MSTELPRPGVEVVQEFRSVSPTVVTPTLVPCVVGVAKQLVEVLETTSSGSQVLNTDALITLPAFAISKAASGSPAVYTGLNGLKLAVIANNAPVLEVTFSDPTAAGLTPATVASQINSALSTAGVASFLAETLEGDKWQLRTVGLGEFQTLLIGPTTDLVVASAFEFGIGRTYQGIGNYNNYQVDVPVEAFPDPNNNLDELSIEFDTVRVFIAAGGGVGLVEFLRDEAFLSNGDVNEPAQVVADLTGITYGAGLDGKTLEIEVDGTAAQLATVSGSPASAAALATNLDGQYTGLTVTSENTDELTFTSGTGGVTSHLKFTDGTLLADMVDVTLDDEDYGENIAAADDGNGDVLTPLLDFAGEDFAGTPDSASVIGTVDLTGLTYPTNLAGLTLVLTDGKQEQTITFSAAIADETEVVSEINAVMGAAAGGKLLASLSTNFLLLTHLDKGDESWVKVVGGTAVTVLGLTVGQEDRGVPFNPLPGDELYIDGVFFANLSQVEPGSVQGRLKLDRQVTISDNVGRRWYIIAKGLVAAGSATRPYPDLVVDSTTGLVQLKHSFLRDTAGDAMAVVGSVYLSYTAVRQDVTSLAAQPGLLTFDSTTDLEAALPPVNTDNPLALGLYYALINATGAQVTGLGVDAISADAPYGTSAAFTRAAEYLEGFEVYALSPLTHDATVGQVFNTHVTFMSEPEQKGERIVLHNPEVPTRALDTLVASDTDGDRLGDTVFDTKIPALTALLQNAGIDPLGTIEVDEGLYLDIASDAYRYSIKSISGSQVTVRTVAGDFAAGENEDNYYATQVLPSPLISETFAVRIRGAELVTITGAVDKVAVAATMANLGQAYQNRRFWLTFPDQARATVDGFEQLVEGFYMNAAIAGMIAQQPPQQSFTNFPMTGFTAVVGSNDTYSESQLNAMAAGGVYIIVQDSQGAPLISRMALTTDMTSIETRTDSITKVVDFTAKFMRRGLKNFIGRFNITQSFLDSLGSVVQGLIGFLVESGVLIGGQLNNIIQDEDAPDTVLIDVTLDVPYPCNYIRLTLVV